MITVLAYAPFAMISEIQIRNFKSIRDLTLKTGRVTVLIGENGSG
jgi:AAA15 family ATPase/GTPase